MAKVVFDIKFDTDADNLKTSRKEVDEMQKSVEELKESASGIGKEFEGLGKSLLALDALGNLFGKLNDSVSLLTSAYAAQEAVEVKLAQVMRNTMGATDDQIQSIKDLCSAQQELGVIGDEVQLAGAQELGTYLEKTDTLKKLIPVMNDMVAQQYGLEASQESAVGIATMLGKVMEGQTSALSRYGYSFDEAQEYILKFGTEEERAAVLADVVSASVGGMNEALAQTSSGQMQQLANTIGDIKEKIGEMLTGIQPAVTVLTEMGQMATGISGLAKSMQMLKDSTLGQRAALLAYNAAQKVVVAATKAWEGVQILLNAVLTANPLGVVVMSITALVVAIKAAYDNFDAFRQVCDKVFSVVANIASIVWNSLCKSFEQASALIKTAWQWLKEFLGLTDDGDVKVEVSTPKPEPFQFTTQVPADLGKKGNAKSQTAAPEGSLKSLQDKIQALQVKVDLEVDPNKRSILYNELQALKKEKFQIEASLELQTNTEKLKTIVPSAKDLPTLKDFKPVGLKGIEQQAKTFNEAQKEMAKNAMTTQEKVLSTAESFGALGEAIGGAAGDMLQWAANTTMAIAQVIPQIMTLITAKEAEGIAGATASGASVMFPANIAAIAAGVATVIASFAKMPKFANGGVISGPTIGLMGEYSGASNNPEVVAPLNKLRSLLIDTPMGYNGKVEFEIKGRKLVGIMAREQSIRSRS